MAGLMSLATGFLKGAETIRNDRAATRQKYIEAGLARIDQIDKERRAELKQQEEYRRIGKIAASMPNAQGTADDYAALRSSGIDVIALMQQGRDPIKRKPVNSGATAVSPVQPMGTTGMGLQSTPQPSNAQQIPMPQVSAPAVTPTQPNMPSPTPPMQAMEAQGGKAGGFERALFGRRETEGVQSGIRDAANTMGINYDEAMKPVDYPQLSETAQLNIKQNPLLGMVASNPELLKHLPTGMLEKEDLTPAEALKLIAAATSAAAQEAEDKEIRLYGKKKAIDLDNSVELAIAKEEAKGAKPLKPSDELTKLKLEIVSKVARGDKLSPGEQRVYDDVIKKGELDMLGKLLAGGGMAGLVGGGTDVGKQATEEPETADAIPVVTTQEEFDNLPEGTQYREEPNGPLFVK